MKSMKLREQAGAGQGLPMSQSESLHTPRVWLLASWAAACLAQRWIIQWRAEVDFPAEVSMLWGHVSRVVD